jgi:predicted PurR-regulated permease PerM
MQSSASVKRGESTPGALIARTLVAIALALLLVYVFDVLLLVFAAVLLATLVRIPTDWLIRRTGMRDSFALVISLACLLVLIGLTGWLLGAAVSQQASQLTERIPEAIESVRERIPQSKWIPDALAHPMSLLQGNESQLLGRGLTVLSATVGALGSFLMLLLMALFLAAQPGLYMRGIVHLIPIPRRERAHQVLNELNSTLRHWLGGQLALMLLVGVLTVIGLTLIGVDFALALGLLAGLLTFIPFLGPILAALPALLIAFADSPTTALYVLLLYIGVQAVESAVGPVVQQKAVYLPPVLLLFGQIVAGLLVGFLGVVLATPMTAALMVLTQMLYVQDVLGDETSKEPE